MPRAVKQSSVIGLPNFFVSGNMAVLVLIAYTVFAKQSPFNPTDRLLRSVLTSAAELVYWLVVLLMVCVYTQFFLRRPCELLRYLAITACTPHLTCSSV